MDEDFDYISEKTFKKRLPKLYRLVMAEAIRLQIPIDTFDFVMCEGIGDLVEVQYTNGEKDFEANYRGGERSGYRLLDSSLTDALEDDDNDIEDDDCSYGSYNLHKDK